MCAYCRINFERRLIQQSTRKLSPSVAAVSVRAGPANPAQIHSNQLYFDVHNCSEVLHCSNTGLFHYTGRLRLMPWPTQTRLSCPLATSISLWLVVEFQMSVISHVNRHNVSRWCAWLAHCACFDDVQGRRKRHGHLVARETKISCVRVCAQSEYHIAT